MIDDETRRELNSLKQGSSFAGGSLALAVAPATSTSVDRRGVSSSSIVHLVAVSSAAANSDIVRIVAAKDSFVVTHTASASARTFRYSFVTPVG